VHSVGARRPRDTVPTVTTGTRVRAALRRLPRLRARLRRPHAWAMHARLRWHARAGLDPHLIVFESFGGRRFAGAPRALYEAMRVDPQYASYRFVWALRDPARATASPALQDERTRVVRFRSAEYYRAFARAQVWISNSILLPELVPSSRQLYVQTWHGTGIKRIGLDVPVAAGVLDSKAEIDDRYRIEATKISLFLSPGPFGTKVFAGAFGLPPSGPDSPFVEVGHPGNDVLVAAAPETVAASRARLSVPARARTVLYAPTFRDDVNDPRSGYRFEQPLELDRLGDALGPEHMLLLRTHYLVTMRSDERGGGSPVRDVSAVEDVRDLLLASDVLVTDYSSLAADYCLLDRPMVFYVYDADRFAGQVRGLYFPIEELPGPLVRTQDELVAALLDPTLAERWAPQRRAFRARICPNDDGQATARALDLIAARVMTAQGTRPRAGR
jgi:CDP-glycerol glycerophosphotransferase